MFICDIEFKWTKITKIWSWKISQNSVCEMKYSFYKSWIYKLDFCNFLHYWLLLWYSVKSQILWRPVQPIVKNPYSVIHCSEVYCECSDLLRQLFKRYIDCSKLNLKSSKEMLGCFLSYIEISSILKIYLLSQFLISKSLTILHLMIYPFPWKVWIKVVIATFS